MSKYRIELGHSELQQRCLAGLYGLLIASVWCWQAQVLPWQWCWQTLVTLFLLYLLYRRLKQPQQVRIFSLSEQGDWQWLDEQPSGLMQISSSSRVTAWLVFISLQDAFDKHQRQYLCVFRDAVSVADYRRLCRIISQGVHPDLEGNR